MRTTAELFELTGRVAVVTGGAGHIGRACAEALAENGATVVIVDVDDAAVACAHEIGAKHGRESIGIAADLQRLDVEPKRVTDMVMSRFNRLDILVNNAAFTGTSKLAGWGVPFAEQSVGAWNAALAVNLGAPFALAQAAAPALAASGHGAIVNVGSIYGVVGPKWSLYEGTTMSNPAAYGASKGGLVQLTRYLATTLAPQVRANCLAPGGVLRGQPASFRDRYAADTPLKRMATEEDFKGAFLYLASDASAYVTGQVLAVDGGWTAW